MQCGLLPLYTRVNVAMKVWRSVLRRRHCGKYLVVLAAATVVYSIYMTMQGSLQNSRTALLDTSLPTNTQARKKLGEQTIQGRYGGNPTHGSATRQHNERRATITGSERDMHQADEERMERRRAIAKRFCSTQKDRGQDTFLANKNLVVNTNPKFLHCPLGKAASTFFSRLVLSLTPSGKMNSPFDFPFVPPGVTPDVRFTSLGSTEARRRFHTEATKNVFVRSPYNRFFSGFVDKIVAPNPIFWKMWGVPSIAQFRKDRNANSAKCGQDVTFAELMSYAAQKLYKTDPHFKAAYIVCQPCGVDYDIIGKMETFSDDLQYLSHRLNLSLVEYFGSAQFRDDFSKDAIKDSILSPFAWMRDIEHCMSKYEAGFRIWRKLQIRGIISRRMLLPFTYPQFLDVNATHFIEVAVEASLQSTDRAELKQQKRDAFLEAYSTVSMDDLKSLQRSYKEEFELFDYDPEPADVFQAGKQNFSRGAFDWRKEWKALPVV